MSVFSPPTGARPARRHLADRVCGGPPTSTARVEDEDPYVSLPLRLKEMLQKDCNVLKLAAADSHPGSQPLGRGVQHHVAGMVALAA